MAGSYILCVGTILSSKNPGITGTTLILSSFLSLGTCVVSTKLLLQGLVGMYLLFSTLN